jgi:hypothetical protein
MSGKSVTSEEIRQTEKLILETIKFDLGSLTLWALIGDLDRNCKEHPRISRKCAYLIKHYIVIDPSMFEGVHLP